MAQLGRARIRRQVGRPLDAAALDRRGHDRKGRVLHELAEFGREVQGRLGAVLARRQPAEDAAVVGVEELRGTLHELAQDARHVELRTDVAADRHEQLGAAPALRSFFHVGAQTVGNLKLGGDGSEDLLLVS